MEEGLELLVTALKEYGMWGLMAVLFGYVIIKSKFKVTINKN